MNPVIAGAISAAVAALGWRLRALTTNGAIAATLVGTSVLAFTGWPGLAVLGTFFVGSTAVSRLARLAGLGDSNSEPIEKETRDHLQVLANGGPALLGAAGDLAVPGLGLWLVSISLAAAASDTWATAFGRLSRKGPVDLSTLRPVSPGTSGGVTWIGTIGGLFGAAIVGLVAGSVSHRWSTYAAATLIGFGSMVVDSLLGSRLQGRFRCPTCGTQTEQRTHSCGTRTALERGLGWLDDNGVNALTTSLATVAGLIAWWR